MSNGSKPEPTSITEEHFARAQKYLLDHLGLHAQRTYGQVVLPNELKYAARIAQWIVDEQTGELNNHDIQRKRWSKLLSASDASKAVNVLVDCGWLPAAIHTGPGRPSKTLQVNPKIHAMKADSLHKQPPIAAQ